MLHFFAIIVAIFVLALLVGAIVHSKVGQLCTNSDEDAVLRLAHPASSGFLSRLTLNRRLKVLREGMPDALDMIANSLSAGLTLPQAMLRNLEHFPPEVGAEMARVLYDTRLGFSIGDAFDNFAQRCPEADFRMIAIASRIGVAHGGKLHENYRLLSALLRDNLAFERELKAMTTEGRMQAIVMSALPGALMAIFALIRWELIKPLFTTGIGCGLLVTLVVMQILAYLWIRKIVSIKI